MESREILNTNISIATLKIQEQYPELVKYIDEIPNHFTINSNTFIDNKQLKDYLNSLNRLLETYAQEQDIALATKNNKTT